jgi:hypothetical protein
MSLSLLTCLSVVTRSTLSVRLALQRLEREHREAREAELRRRGSEIADAVVESLLTLRDTIPYVHWMGPGPHHEERYDAEVRAAQKQVLLLPDRPVRERLTVALDVLEWPHEVWQWVAEPSAHPRRRVGGLG